MYPRGNEFPMRSSDFAPWNSEFVSRSSKILRVAHLSPFGALKCLCGASNWFLGAPKCFGGAPKSFPGVPNLLHGTPISFCKTPKIIRRALKSFSEAQLCSHGAIRYSHSAPKSFRGA